MDSLISHCGPRSCTRQTYSISLFQLPRVRSATTRFLEVSEHFPEKIYEQGACIGIPLIVIATIWSRRHRGEFLTKVLIATVIVSCVLACGPFLRVAGHPVFPMPWLLIEKLPLIKSALPVRLVMYAFLALSVIFTMWLSDPLTGRSEKIVGVVATLIMLMPNPAASFWASRAPLPMSSAMVVQIGCSLPTTSCCRCLTGRRECACCGRLRAE